MINLDEFSFHHQLVGLHACELFATCNSTLEGWQKRKTRLQAGKRATTRTNKVGV